MTYGFTQKSQEFIDQLPESYDFNTIEDYQKLASGTEFGNSSSETTTLTLNKLVSKYAAYIKNVESVVVTKLNKSDSDNYTANVETGSYLVIPTTSNTYIITEYNELVHSMYAVSVANVIFTVSQGNWELNSASMSLKDSHESTGAAIFNDELDTIVNTGKIKDNSTYSASKDLYFLQCLIIILLTYQLTLMIVLLNNSTIMDKILKRNIVFPTGLTYDLNEIYSVYYDETEEKWMSFKTTIRDNSIYGLEDDGVTEMKLVDFTQNAATNSIIFKNWTTGSYSSNLFFKLKVNDNIKLGTPADADSLNTITTNAYYLKDAYVDISSMSQEEAEAAVLGVGTLTNTLYTYGVKVTNKDNSTLLNGAKFQVCLDENCNTKVGEEFAITENGTYTFKGLNDTDTYYLKQTKASTGYKMASTITLSPTSLNKETGYYDVEVTSAKMGLLPTTGGLGTILYTTFGLLIIVVGSITFISYRKRQVNVNN